MDSHDADHLLKQVTDRNGGPVEMEVNGVHLVFMSLDVFQDLTGTEGATPESIAAVHQGLKDVDAGRTRPFRDALNDLAA